MLCPLIALLSCEQRQATQLESNELLPEEMIGDVPSWAVDLHSREGRAALVQEALSGHFGGHGSQAHLAARFTI
jgi:hypothetical protein